jgi:hypothetical protein
MLSMRYLRPEGAVEIPPEQAGKGECKGCPGDDPCKSFFDPDPMHFFAAEDKQVQRQHGENKNNEASPHGTGGKTIDGSGHGERRRAKLVVGDGRRTKHLLQVE